MTKRKEKEREAYFQIALALGVSGLECNEVLLSAVRYFGGEDALAKSIAADKRYCASPEGKRLIALAHATE
jgi:hypothetical protein